MVFEEFLAAVLGNFSRIFGETAGCLRACFAIMAGSRATPLSIADLTVDKQSQAGLGTFFSPLQQCLKII